VSGELAAPDGAAVMDASSLFIVPGLWDMHIHLTSPGLEDRVLKLLVANGVTSVRDTGGELEAVLAIRERANRVGEVAPRVWVAGPILDGKPRAWRGHSSSLGMIEVDSGQEALELVDTLAARGVDFIKLYEMLRPDVFRAIVKRAHEHGLRVTAHVPIRMTTMQTLDAGLDGIEHLRGIEFDCAEQPEALLAQRVAIMDAWDSDDGGYALRRKVHATLRPDALTSQSPANCGGLVDRFTDQGTWHTPTLHFVAFRVLRFYEDSHWIDPLRYLPEDIRAQRMAMLADFKDLSKYKEWETHGEWAMHTVARLHQAGATLMTGTDSPGFIFMPGFSLHDELEALVRAGLTPLAALQAATITPARFFDVDDQLGTIEAGKLADLVLLEGDPLSDVSNTRRIAAVIVKGRLLDRKELDGILDGMSTERNLGKLTSEDRDR
jgi:imidazolonepropionase-like amidohydrolase